MFDRFSDTSARLVVLAQEEARLLRHDWIGAEHLLLGLLQLDDRYVNELVGPRLPALEEVRAAVDDRTAGPLGSDPLPSHIPFNPAARKTLEMTLREALNLGRTNITPDLVLVALVGCDEPIVTDITTAAGLDQETLRAHIRANPRDPHKDPLPAATAHNVGLLRDEVDYLRTEIEALRAEVAELRSALGQPRPR